MGQQNEVSVISPSILSFAAKAGGFFARHSLATLATAGVACALWSVTYAALLVWAVLSGGGLGGPLAYPGGLVLVALGTVMLCCGLLGPATGVAEWLVRRRRLPILVGIPASVGALVALCTLAVAAGSVARVFGSVPAAAVALAALVLSLLLPLGFYWWVAEIGPVLVSAGGSLIGMVGSIPSALRRVQGSRAAGRPWRSVQEEQGQ